MKVTQMVVKYEPGRVRGYQTAGLGCSMTLELEEGDTPLAAYKRAKKFLIENLDADNELALERHIAAAEAADEAKAAALRAKNEADCSRARAAREAREKGA